MQMDAYNELVEEEEEERSTWVSVKQEPFEFVEPVYPGFLWNNKFLLGIPFVLLVAFVLVSQVPAFEPLWERLIEDDGWILYLIQIPLTCTIVSYATNALALYMMFRPLHYVGFFKSLHTKYGFSLGWQGIVPFKAVKMACIAVDLMTTKLISVSEVFSRVDPVRVHELMEPTMNVLLMALFEGVAQRQIPMLWRTLPQRVKDRLVEKAVEQSPETVRRMMEDVRDHIEEVFDLRDMVVQRFVKEPELLNNFFFQCGQKELKIVRCSGAYLGFFFGCCQMLIYYFAYNGFDETALWILPVTGLFVGLFTNYIALFMIFRPVDPIRCCCGCSIQGLFMKRQEEVAKVYAHTVTQDIVTARQMLKFMIRGRSSDGLFELIARHVEEAVERYSDMGSSVARLTVGTEQWEYIKAEVSEHVLELVDSVPDKIDHMFPTVGSAGTVNSPPSTPTSLSSSHDSVLALLDYIDDALSVKATIYEKLRKISSHDFERMLHPVFEEDEWMLIAVGAVLGVVVGVLQVVAMEPLFGIIFSEL